VINDQTLATDEIDLLELLRIFWRYKLSVILITILFMLGGIVVALVTPKTYQADVLISSTQSEGQDKLSSLASQYGGLAAMAGINLGSSDNGLESSLALLESRKFIISIINSENLKPALFPDTWDKLNQQWLKPKIGIIERLTNRVLSEISNDDTDPTPSDLKAYEVMKGLLSVQKDKQTNLVTIKVQSEDPNMAADLANKLVVRLNEYLRNEAITQSKNSIRYLEQEIAETPLVEFRTALYTLIEAEARTIMLANVNQEYAFKVIDPALIPEQAIKPKRVLIVILAMILGFMFACLMVVLRYWLGDKD